MTDSTNNNHDIVTLLAQIAKHTEKEKTPFKDFSEAANKFGDAMSSLKNFLSNFLTEQGQYALSTLSLRNLSDSLHFNSPATIYSARQVALANAGNADEADDLFKHAQNLASGNGEKFQELQKLLGSRKKLKDDNGNISENLLQLVQEGLRGKKPEEERRIFDLLGLDYQSGLRRALSSGKDISAQMAGYKEDAITSPDALNKNQEFADSQQKAKSALNPAHQKELERVAPAIERLDAAFTAIAKSHPEIVADGLLAINAAILALHVTAVASTAITAGKAASALAEKATPAIAEATATIMSQSKTVAGAAAKAAAPAARAAAPAARAAAGGLLGSFGIDLAGIEAVGVGGALEFGVSALLAPEVVLPVMALAAGAYGYHLWQKHQEKQAEDAQKAEEEAAQKATQEVPGEAPPLPDIPHAVKQADQVQAQKIHAASQQSGYFQALNQKTKDGRSPLGPTQVKFGDIIVNNPETDDPFDFAERVVEVMTQEVQKLSASLSPFF